MNDRSYDESRLKQLIHYVISVAGGRPNFGATKLYKVAWFADARQFLLTGKSITGSAYIKEEFGPIPKFGRAVRETLASEGAIKQWRDTGLYGEPWKFRSLTNPDVNAFSSEERKNIDFWIKHIDENHTASTISEESHDYGWEIAELKEALPFHAFLAERIREPNDEEFAWAKQQARELGLI